MNFSESPARQPYQEYFKAFSQWLYNPNKLLDVSQPASKEEHFVFAALKLHHTKTIVAAGWEHTIFVFSNDCFWPPNSALKVNYDH